MSHKKDHALIAAILLILRRAGLFRPGRLILPWIGLCLAGCAGVKYTVDDGRKVDEALYEQIQTYGRGERALRPAIARAAALKDPDCDKQWELPFAIASSDGWSADDRIAWARALGVDERLTVIATAPDSPLRIGEKIEAIEGYNRPDQSEEMLARLVKSRDFGHPFNVTTSTGSSVTVKPFETCRGYTRFSPPNTPRMQDYHWLMSLHPLEVARADLSPDEALWSVLWTQGLSEEGGLRMKAYHYSTSLVSTLYSLATVASGLKGAALAAEAAVNAAQAAATKVASEVVKQQLIEQAKAYAGAKLREGIADAAEKLGRGGLMSSLQTVAANRGALIGVAWVAATVFDQADRWAFERMVQLDSNPLAGFTLHQKLIERGFLENALAFDVDRLSAVSRLASAKGMGEAVASILNGLNIEQLQETLTAMPLASETLNFTYDMPPPTADGRFSRGLIEAMLEMPVGSGSRP